ncbi:MAG TPA: TerB N-terminal domain-containing protein, partial [Streptosporangiaceae bacterium]
MRWKPRAGSAPPTRQIGWTLIRHPVTVAGLTFQGNMLYIGSGLMSASGTVAEPSLIDPRLRVDWRSPDWRGEKMGYWPSYATITPASRAAYLHWLATERRHPNVYIGYVFLFFYGLERRVLFELPHLPQALRFELPAIRAEVDQLLRLYGDNRSFAGYAGSFRDVLDTIGLLDSDVCAGPAPLTGRDSLTPRLQLGLSGFATARRPVPGDWALSWLKSSADFQPRAAITRCEPEFAQLFLAQYAEHCGPGMVIRPEGPAIRLDYRPASAGFRNWNGLVLHGRPEVFGHTSAERALIRLGEECAQALDAYGRYLGREPDSRGSIAATALLPAELLNAESGEAGTVISWARGRLGESVSTTVAAEELFKVLPASPSAPRKKDIVAVTQLLSTAGIGVEPDPRFGGPTMTSGPMVLFNETERCSAPSPAYHAATLLLHLGVAVSAADGQLADQERDVLVGHLERALYLSGAEQERLRAHLEWLLSHRPKLTGLTRRIAALDETRREDIAAFLATVATADGVIEPAEIATLKRIRKLLGLDPEEVHVSLHTAAAAPVVVRPADPAAGYTIPASPAERSRVDTRVRLDEAALAAKLAEAAEVAALLDAVFADDEPQSMASAAPQPPDVEPVAGLDAGH